MRMVGAVLVAACLTGGTPVAAQDVRPLVGVDWGDHLRVRFPASVQLDWQRTAEAGDLDLKRLRLEAEGRLLERVAFQVEREFTDESPAWHDVYADVRLHRAVHVRGGRFKIPVHTDFLTPLARGDFVRRSLTARRLAPGFDEGAAVHGTILKGIKYSAGAFRGHSDRARTLAGRLTMKPRSFALGAAVAITRTPVTTYELPTGGGLVFVNGRRRYASADVEWRGGPLSVHAEVLQVTQQRRGQGVSDDDLPALVARGWYTAGTWRVVRAVSVVARMERLVAHSGDADAQRLLTPRSPAFGGERTDLLTLGGHWQPRPRVRVLANAGPEMATRAGEQDAPRWTHTVRLQLEL